MVLYYPIWLVLSIPIAVSFLLWRPPTGMLGVVRGATVLVLLLALCRPAVKLPGRAGTVVVVADRSESMPAGSGSIQKEGVDLVQSRMGADDRLAVVSFGRTAVVEQPPQTGKFPGFVSEVGEDQSNLADALETALALIPADGAGRVLVLSDGRWTGADPLNLAARFAVRDVALDYRLLERTGVRDLAIDRVEAPELVTPGQSYLITGWISSPVRQEVQYEFRRGAAVLAAGRKTVPAGLSRLMFRDVVQDAGACSYRLAVQGEGEDPMPENNRARLIVGVKGPRPVLCVRPREEPSGLAAALAADGLEVKSRRAGECRWALAELAGCSAVVLENVMANELGTRGMDSLAAWVRETGAGLMLTGGQHAYGPGGYFQSPLDPIMPVSMELRKEHRKLSLAMVVALDRSGSMQAGAGGGKRKMDLANIGTVQVLDLLSEMDEFGVIAVDSSPHVIVDIDTVQKNRSYRGKILKIDSMGGGIFVYEALAASVKMLMKAKAGTRHIILFADAADSEEPGAYKQLLAKAAEANITVSVVGLGRPTDCDARLLEDVAQRGGGQCFFTESAHEVPRLFAQDTFSVARSTFVTDPAALKLTGGLRTLTDLPFEAPPALGGYNLCYIKPSANLAAVTGDENSAPVVASWQAGAGRVLCYTGEADGEFSGAFAKWPKAGPFLAALTRWTVGRPGELPHDALLVQEVRDGLYKLELHLAPDREQEAFSKKPTVRLLRGLPGEKPTGETAVMQWQTADLLSVQRMMSGQETLVATVEVPGYGRVSLTPVCLPYSTEFKPDEGNRKATLAQLARATKGVERIDLPGIWKDLPRKPRLFEIAPGLLLAALAGFLLEVFQRRTGLLSVRRRAARPETAPAAGTGRARAARPLPRRRAAKAPKAGPAPRGPKQSAPAPETGTAPAEEAEEPSAIAAMRKARRRAKGRM